MKTKFAKKRNADGFSLIELMISMTVTLVILAFVASMFAKVLGTRTRESRRTDALTSAQAALDVMSREISNAGFGLVGSDGVKSNGIITADSGDRKLHFRANTQNTDLTTNQTGENITYYFDALTESIVRYDPNATQKTSAIINRISDVKFEYFNYSGSVSATPPPVSTPTADTSRVRITVIVKLEDVQGQPANQKVSFTSDVTLRNSNYMLNKY